MGVKDIWVICRDAGLVKTVENHHVEGKVIAVDVSGVLRDVAAGSTSYLLEGDVEAVKVGLRRFHDELFGIGAIPI